MTGESFAILAVILVMDVMLLRAEKKSVALLSLPLVTVPVFYLLAIGIGALIPVSAGVLIPGMVLAGTLVGIAGCGALTLFIVNKAGKTGYFALGAIYLVALTIAYFMRLSV